MSKFSLPELWKKRYGDETEVTDYAGRRMTITAHTNPHSDFQPTLDHVRPIAEGGKDVEENIEICNRISNAEKGDSYPHWRTGGALYCAKKRKGTRDGYYPQKLSN